jgi:muscarinic acetylcholine receptor
VQVAVLQRPSFNTALIVEYYWNTLVVLFVLYGGMYKTAYDMQKKSEVKQRKMQSMFALSAEDMTEMVGRPSGIGISKTHNTLLNQDKPKSIGRGDEGKSSGGGCTQGHVGLSVTTASGSANSGGPGSGDSASSQKTSSNKTTATTTTTTTAETSFSERRGLVSLSGAQQIECERYSSLAFESDEYSTTAVSRQ